MTVSYVDFLGISFLTAPQASIRQYLIDRSQQVGVQVVSTINPEMVSIAMKDARLMSLFHHSICLADGTGIVMFARVLFGIRLVKMTGIELCQTLLDSGALKFYLLGAHPDVLTQCLARLSARYPGASIVGSHHGYFSEEDWGGILIDIQCKEPDFVLLGLGFPKQQWVSDRIKQSLKRGIVVGVGGAFDVWSLSKKRAPVFIQKMGLEWLFRTMIEPRRIRRWPLLGAYVIYVLKKRFF